MTATEQDKQTPVSRLDDWYPALGVRKGSGAAALLANRRTTIILSGVGMATVLLMLVVLFLSQPDPRRTQTATHPTDTPTSAARTPFDTAAVADPCQGFTGDLVTTHDGDQTSPLNVVAALEYAFYVKRDPNAVIGLYLPAVLAGDAKAAIAGFITHIPTGVRYCVAATMSGPDVVNYDVRDIRPDPDSKANAVPITKNFAMTLTVTPTAPYFISTLRTRK